MILHDFSLYTSLHLPGETRVTSVTYSTLIDFMLHVVTQNALFSLCIKKIPRNSLSRFITKHITYQKLEIPSNHSYPCPCGRLSPRMAGASNGQMQDRVSLLTRSSHTSKFKYVELFLSHHESHDNLNSI